MFNANNGPLLPLQTKPRVEVWIAGAGGFGREVWAWLKRQGTHVAGFLDDNTPFKIDAYERQDNEEVIVAIASPGWRLRAVERLAARGALFHGLHSHIAPSTVKIGGGCILCPQSVISNGADVGDFCHVNVLSSVGHDVKLGDFCTLSSHVDLCGNVEVGECTFFGSGARVLPGVKIGKNCVIGAGAVVGRDVPDGTTIYQEFGRPLVTAKNRT